MCCFYQTLVTYLLMMEEQVYKSSNPGLGVRVYAAEELLRAIPGITAKNVKYMMGKVGSVRGLCDMSVDEIKRLFGTGPGKACWNFLHWSERKISNSGSECC